MAGARHGVADPAHRPGAALVDDGDVIAADLLLHGVVMLAVGLAWREVDQAGIAVRQLALAGLDVGDRALSISTMSKARYSPSRSALPTTPLA
jgi:hypothetical protein